MGAISANTLFHFTNSIDNLVNILNNNFIVRDCEETNICTGEKWHVPMVCFCDIPLSQIQEHSSWYGEYAIGMKKEWAIEKQINPVFYINEGVNIANTFCRNSAMFISNDDDMHQNRYQLAYLKPYKGTQYNKKSEKEEEKIFYNEREWRFVPNDNQLNKLYFQPKNINFIIVAKENEILEIKHKIESIKNHNFSFGDVELLVTRIISMERIKQDL